MNNLETRWINEANTKEANRNDVTSRLGNEIKNCTLLSGGLANNNYDLGNETILRIYKRSAQTATIELEEKLNNQQWQHFKTAKTIARGDDFLVQEKLYFSELQDTFDHGLVAGRAIGEIHQTKSTLVEGHNGFLTTLFNNDALSGLITEKLIWAIRSRNTLAFDDKEQLINKLSTAVENSAVEINQAVADQVMLHGDCKPSNVKLSTTSNCATIFDWEFAFAGPRLVDIGHFLRWGVSAQFLEGFVISYQEQTDIDLTDQLRTASLMDFVNLSFQLANASQGSAKEEDILRYFSDFD